MMISKSNHQDARGNSPGSFATHSLTLYNLGIPTIPCGKDDGKHPLVKWTQFQKELPTKAQLQLWGAKFPDANLGIITGEKSNLTVLDCDDRDMTLEELEQRFSESNFVVRSPRGGLHLYYSHSGEGSSQGAYPSIDIRGQGGLIIGPFSIKRDKNVKYEIIKGGWSDLKQLTPLQNLDMFDNRKSDTFDTIKKGQCNKRVTIKKENGSIEVGSRNNTLFLAVKEAAFTTESQGELLAFAQHLNQEEMQQPLSNNEVQATVNKVWEYKQQNRLIPKGISLYLLSADEFEALKDEPNALVLYQLLRKKHSHIRNEFFIAQDKVAGLLGWRDRRCVSKAIQVLIARKKITLVKRGSGQGSAHTYAFC